MTRPWTAPDVPVGPYFHGTLFDIEAGSQFDLSVPRFLAPDNDWGVVNNQEAQDDPRAMFWATTDPQAALSWGTRYGMRFEGRLDRVYVWEVDFDGPEVDVNDHVSEHGIREQAITSVMAPSGRFVRIVDSMLLADYHQLERDRR